MVEANSGTGGDNDLTRFWKRFKEQHVELTIREKELQFTKDEKDKVLEVRMLIDDKDCKAMKFKENNALLCAVVGSSRSVKEITKISKNLFNR
ncbi:hypothetical protein BY996DRAFT_6531059 [Phakopsora pachyrhizi]|nr:hypothetical protein BY996DRAFT_6531059 [Phakopsora pachyrhizi]